MFRTAKAVEVSNADPTEFLAKVNGDIDRADAEVTRLKAVVEAASSAVAAAEARATDAVSAPDFDAGSDADVMAAVGAARARLDAAVAAHQRAQEAAATIRATLPAIQRRVQVRDGLRELDAMSPLLRDFDRGFELIAAAWLRLEQHYHNGTRAVIESVDWQDRGVTVPPSPPALNLGARLHSMLYHRLGKGVLGNLGSVDMMRPDDTFASSVEEITASIRRLASKED